MVLLAGFLILLHATASHAQTQPESPAATETKPAANGVREVKPQVFYLKDKDGNLLPVPDFSLEEFRRLYDLAQGLNSEPPPYTIRTVKIDGAVRGAEAELAVELTVVQTGKTSQWVRVPLRFNTAVLRDSPQHSGEGDSFVDYEPEGDGYVWWLRGKENSQHKLECKFLAKVQDLGAESRLALAAPRGTSGVLALRVPVEKAEARIIRRAGDEALAVVAEGKGSRLEMAGPAGDFQLAWRASAGADRTRSALEAHTALQVKLESRRRMTVEARLKLRPSGAPLETARVRLPPGMRLTSQDQPQYQVNTLEPELDPLTKKLVQIVEIRLAAKASAPVDVILQAEHIRDNGSSDLPVELGGFEVLDAIKQTGVIDIAVEGDLSALWVEGSNVRRVEELPPADAARLAKPVARFEFDAQPFSLQVQAVPQRTRVTLEPQYVVYVERQQLRLEATLKYKVRGAKMLHVEYDFDGWTIDRVGPEAAVQVDGLQLDKVTPLKIPLAPTAIGPSGEFELRITAHRDLPPGAGAIAFDVPRVVTGSAAGGLAVVPADNIELTVEPSELAQLVNDPLPETLKLPPRQQAPLYFRESGGGAKARFAAKFAVRQQTVTVATRAATRFDAASVHVQQTLTLQIAYEPLRSLVLEVPRAAWDAGNWQLLLDGAPLPATLEADPVLDEAALRAKVRVDLVSDRIGRLELAAQYTLPLPEMAASGVTPFELELIRPQLGKAQSSVVTSVTLPQNEPLLVVPSESARGWTESPRAAGAASGRSETEWTRASSVDALPLALAPRPRAAAANVVLEQAWIQTWLTPLDRQDRAVFRIRTAAERVQFRLPPQTQDSSLEVAANGRHVAQVTIDAEGIVTVPLPAQRAGEAFVIELWYEFTRGRPAVGEMHLEAVQLEGAATPLRIYWQLVLPGDEYVVVDPRDAEADQVWQWRGWLYSRTSALTQRELEHWIGATEQAPLPASAKVVLYSSFGKLPALHVRTETRRMLLWVSSGGVLLAGLALLYWRAARHPAMLLILAVALAALALWHSEVALLGAQTSVLGLIALAMARVLQLWLGTRETAGGAVIAGGLSAIEARSTEPHPRPDHGSQATTAAAVAAGAAIVTAGMSEAPP